MSEKTRSLIYRELSISKKFYLSMIGMVILLLAFFWMILLSCKYGNINKLGKSEPEVCDMIFMTANALAQYALAIFMGSLICGNTSAITDIKSKWKPYSFVLPVTVKEQLKAKIIIKLALTVLSLLLCILNSWTICLFTGEKLTRKMVFILIWIINLCLLSDMIKAPIQLRANTEKEANLSFISDVIIMASAYVCTYFLYKEVQRRGAEDLAALADNDNAATIAEFAIIKDIIYEIVDKLEILAIPAMIVIFVLSFFLEYKAMQRREK